MFVFTMPKEFGRNQKITWSLTVNNVTTSVPFSMSPDYNVSPLRASEEGPTGAYNLPPVLRFAEDGPSFAGPLATPSRAVQRTAVAGVPMPLDFFAEDDALYASGTNAPMFANRAPVALTVTKYRGPGAVRLDGQPKFEATKGGAPNEPYAGRGSANVTFDTAGDYMLHVTANDYSGNGGGGTVCCWTTALVKVSVTGAPATSTNGQ
jgi:hypothetical protein